MSLLMSFLTVFTVAVVLTIAQGLYRNWGRKTFDALPSTIDEPHEWDGKDHDKVWYTRWVKYVKGWFAVGPLSDFKWARWRTIPKTLFAIKGEGPWRFEQDGADEDVGGAEWSIFGSYLTEFREFYGGDTEWYLSRVQYYCRWHFAIQWPLQVSFHYYWNKDAMPRYPLRTGDTTWKDMLFFYGPTHRDADRVYWIWSFFLGTCWK